MSDFEWDAAKDKVNRAKHGIGFELAQQAFLDPSRVSLQKTSRTVATSSVISVLAGSTAPL